MLKRRIINAYFHFVVIYVSGERKEGVGYVSIVSLCDCDRDVVQDVGVFKRNNQSNVGDVAFNKYWLLPLSVE